MRGKDLPDLIQIARIVDQHQHDRQVARNTKGPKPGLRPRPRDDPGRPHPQARITAQDEPGKRLEIRRFGVGYPQMAQFHLRLRPGQGGGPVKGGRIAMPVDQFQQGCGCFSDHCPERDPRHAARRNRHPAAD